MRRVWASPPCAAKAGTERQTVDSLSQLALGAACGLAVMGRRTAAWKAAVWGGVAGTLPDLDALVDHGDAVLNMVLHRAESHSLLFLALLSVPMGWAIARLHGQIALGWRWVAAMALALVTHPLLDLMTVYGTQVLQPFTDEAYGVGSMFIIDPLYTLPLLLGVGAALRGRPSGNGLNRAGLAVSTAYLAWSTVAQGVVTLQAEQSLRALGLPTDRVLVTPAPLTTVVWRVVAMDGDRYHEGFYALLDKGRPIRFTTHAQGQALALEHAAHPHVQRIARFSDGFFRMSQTDDGSLWLTDLRMGQEPNYSFHFNIGPALAPGATPPAATQNWMRIDTRAGLRWLWQRVLGRDVAPPGNAPLTDTTERTP